MTACQIMTQSGGWPLTIIMDPESRKPLFAGTYFPKESKYGRVGLKDLLLRIKSLWDEKRDELLQSAENVVEIMQKDSIPNKGKKLGEEEINTAFENLYSTFDSERGGFGKSPKFPTPHILRFLLRYWHRYNSDFSLFMVEKTLQNMRMGGIYDHIGFGFHRYSTDAKWLVPHFEKMLYDQALISMAYTEVYQITGKKEYEETVREIFTYVLRDMTSPDGGFYSAEDADVEGEEGKFYLWKESEIQELLSEDDAHFLNKIFNIEKRGNYFDQIESSRTGKNILYLKKPVKKLSSDYNMKYEQLKSKINEIRKKLYEYRKNRIHPMKDDKILTDWNGLMISALAKASKVFNEPRFAQEASKAVDFIFKQLFSNNILFHRYRNGEVDIQGNLDDYSFLIWGLIELYEATFNTEYLQKALQLNTILIEKFWDQEAGGFYFSPPSAEDLLVRQKEIYDGAIPSGNSISMLNLLKLGRITNDPELENMALKISEIFSNRVKRSPTSFTQLLIAVDFELGPVKEIVISGNPKSPETYAMLKIVRGKFLPHKVVLFNPTNQNSPSIYNISEFIKNQPAIGNKTTAYVCANYSCQEPTNNIKELEKLLEQ
jgi:hypothetical protein